MTRVAERSRVSAAEYLAWEREQRAKHEFFHGEVFAMAGGSQRHNFLSGRVHNALSVALGTCFVFPSDQRIGMEASERYVYPDVSVVCGKTQSEPGAKDVIVNPTILVEVVSTSTEQYDRGDKWEGYQRIASLTDYLLVSQTHVRIEQFQRSAAGWTYRAYGSGERIKLANGAELEVDAIFAGAFELPSDEAVPPDR